MKEAVAPELFNMKGKKKARWVHDENNLQSSDYVPQQNQHISFGTHDFALVS